MTEKELTVLGHLSPQDYLQFMQAVWAQVTVLTPETSEICEMFSQFSDELNELERLVVKELEPGKSIQPDTLQILNILCEKMDDTFQKLQKELKLSDYMTYPQLLNTH